MAEVENEISQETLEIANVRARIERLMKITADLDDQIAGKNEIISRSEAEIVKRNAIIERKQNIIDQFNKKLEQMISKAGVRCLAFLELGVQWLSSRVLDSRPRGRRFEPHQRHCVVSLSKTH